MKRFPLYWLSTAFAMLVIAGCGGNDVVRVDRTKTNANSNSSASTNSSSSSGNSNWNDSRDNNSQPSAQNNSATANSTTANSTTANTPQTIIVDAPPANVPMTVDPTVSADPATPAGPPMETAPSPSDYRVVLPEGGSLDINKLLETERDDFETKLAAIAEGKLMLRTYYTTEVPAGSTVPGQTGPTGPKEILIESPDQTPANPAAAPPQSVPNAYQPGAARPPGGINRRGGSSRFGRSQPVQQPRSEVDPNKPFMYIGRIAATLRGPTAAFYRDGTPMVYTSYDRDSRRHGTFISWDEKGRPVVIDQFSGGRRNGMRVLFRERSENDPTGRVALVQQWRAGKLSATHLVADHGGALTINEADPLPDETNDELTDSLQELEEFDEKLHDNELELRKAVTAFHREQIRLAKAARSAFRAQQQAAVQQAQLQILNQLQSGIQSPSAWRQGYRSR